MKRISSFKIAARREYGDHYFGWTLESPERLESIEAGQFVEVEVKDCKEVLLRRPISIHDFDEERGRIDLLIQVVGKGTRKLAEAKEGEEVSVVYPLGKGFGVRGRNPLLVGGGAGVAPLLGLAKAYNAKGVKPTVLLGGRTAELIAARERFEGEIEGRIAYATEDGTLGERGMVTGHSVFGEGYDQICTCGPTPMMKAVARYAMERGMECEVSLENMMACGVGACLCCVCDTDEGHKCVCKEGPVFDIKNMKKWMA